MKKFLFVALIALTGCGSSSGITLNFNEETDMITWNTSRDVYDCTLESNGETIKLPEEKSLHVGFLTKEESATITCKQIASGEPVTEKVVLPPTKRDPKLSVKINPEKQHKDSIATVYDIEASNVVSCVVDFYGEHVPDTLNHVEGDQDLGVEDSSLVGTVVSLGKHPSLLDGGKRRAPKFTCEGNYGKKVEVIGELRTDFPKPELRFEIVETDGTRARYELEATHVNKCGETLTGGDVRSEQKWITNDTDAPIVYKISCIGPGGEVSGSIRHEPVR